MRDGGGEPEQHAVAGLRGLGEAQQVGALDEVRGAVGDRLPAVLYGEMAQLAGDDGELALGGEDDGFLAVGALGGGLGAHRDPDGVLLRGGQPERHIGARGGRREEGDADEVEEGQVVLLGDPVEPVDDLVGHVGDRFHEGDTGVGHVVVGPLRGAPLDVALGVVDELLEAPVVEVRGRQCHQRSLSVAGPPPSPVPSGSAPGPSVSPGSSWEGMT